MASLSETILSQKPETESLLDRTQKATNTGLKLATIQEDVESRRQELEMKKQQVLDAKFDNQLTWIDRIAKASSPSQKKIMMEAANRNFALMGLPEMSKMTQEEMLNDPQVQANLKLLLPALRNAGVSEDLVQEISGGLASEVGIKEALDLLMKSQQQKKDESRENIRMAREERQLKQRETTELVSAQKDFEGFKDVKDLRDSFNSSEDALELLQTANNPTALKAGQYKIAKMIQGAGVLTDSDVKLLGGSPDILNTLNTYKERWLNGEITEKDQKYLTEIARLMKDKRQKQLTERADEFSETRGFALGKSPEQLLPALLPKKVRSKEQAVAGDTNEANRKAYADFLQKKGMKPEEAMLSAEQRFPKSKQQVGK